MLPSFKPFREMKYFSVNRPSTSEQSVEAGLNPNASNFFQFLFTFSRSLYPSDVSFINEVISSDLISCTV